MAPSRLSKFHASPPSAAHKLLVLPFRLFVSRAGNPIHNYQPASIISLYDLGHVSSWALPMEMYKIW